MGGRGSFGERGNASKTVTALHFTSQDNVKSILSGDFDLSKSGSGAGSTWGNGIYFSTEKLEQDVYSTRFKSNKAIEAEIDTSKMFTADLGTSYMDTWDVMYKKVVSQLPKGVQQEYKNYIKTHKDEKVANALSTVISNHYTGLIIKQNASQGFDDISGGNQIVVYDKSVIHNKKAKIIGRK